MRLIRFYDRAGATRASSLRVSGRPSGYSLDLHAESTFAPKGLRTNCAIAMCSRHVGTRRTKIASPASAGQEDFAEKSKAVGPPKASPAGPALWHTQDFPRYKTLALMSSSELSSSSICWISSLRFHNRSSSSDSTSGTLIAVGLFGSRVEGTSGL